MANKKEIGTSLRCFALFALAALLPCYGMAAGKAVTVGSKVTLEYSIALVTGAVVMSNAGQAPLETVVGKKAIFPEVERQLVGMAVNATKEITLTPQQAFGPVDKQKFVRVKLNTVPEKSRRVGADLVATAPNGGEQTVIVAAVNGEFAVLNFNHPLSGQTVKVKVKVLSIK